MIYYCLYGVLMGKMDHEADQSLTTRHETDLFWKKRRKMLESAERKGMVLSIHDFYEKKLRSFDSSGKERRAVKPLGDTGESLFSFQPISGYCCDEFVSLIPDSYMVMIRRGGLAAEAVYYTDPLTGSSLCAVTVNVVHPGWLEIVYLYISEEFRTEEQIRDILLYLIHDGHRRDGGSLYGAFMEMPADEVYPALRNALTAAGMEAREEKANTYRFSLSDVTEKDMMRKAAAKAELCLLKDAKRQLRGSVERMMREDPRPIAADPYVAWEEYLGDLSMICLEGGKPAGLILVSEQEGHPVLDLVYAASKTALPKLLGGVLKLAEKRYSPDWEFVVPIVAGNSREILERIVPNGRRRDTFMAVLWFDED